MPFILLPGYPVKHQVGRYVYTIGRLSEIPCGIIQCFEEVSLLIVLKWTLDFFTNIILALYQLNIIYLTFIRFYA